MLFNNEYKLINEMSKSEQFEKKYLERLEKLGYLLRQPKSVKVYLNIFITKLLIKCFNY